MGRLRMGRIDPEVMKVLRQIDSELERLNHQNIDLNKRRFLNAHDAVSRGDFITKRQLDEAVSELKDKVQTLSRRRRALVSGGGATTPTQGNLPTATHPMDYGYWIPDGNAPNVP